MLEDITIPITIWGSFLIANALIVGVSVLKPKLAWIGALAIPISLVNIFFAQLLGYTEIIEGVATPIFYTTLIAPLTWLSIGAFIITLLGFFLSEFVALRRG